MFRYAVALFVFSFLPNLFAFIPLVGTPVSILVQFHFFVCNSFFIALLLQLYRFHFMWFLYICNTLQMRMIEK